MKYKIADVIVKFNPRYHTCQLRMEKYLCNENSQEDFEIIVDDESLEREVEISRGQIDFDMAEYMIVGTRFYRGLLNHKGCLLHASAVVIDDEAYLFSANCGTGKSTHTGLWLKYLADKHPYILNDDKPAIRIMENGIFAYGTPFCGKNDINENKRVRLKAICFLEQSKINFIQKVDPKEAVVMFFEQTVRRLSEENMIKFFEVLDIILREIPSYKLYCDMSKEAVQLSYQTMKGKNKNED